MSVDIAKYNINYYIKKHEDISDEFIDWCIENEKLIIIYYHHKDLNTLKTYRQNAYVVIYSTELLFEDFKLIMISGLEQNNT